MMESELCSQNVYMRNDGQCDLFSPKTQNSLLKARKSR